MATSSAMKTLWHNRGSADSNLSLKQFAQKLLEMEGENAPVARDWFAHKMGVLEREAKEDRMKRKGGQLAEIRLKVRAARRKSASNTAKPETAKKDKGKKGQSPSTTPVKK